MQHGLKKRYDFHLVGINTFLMSTLFVLMNMNFSAIKIKLIEMVCWCNAKKLLTVKFSYNRPGLPPKCAKKLASYGGPLVCNEF